jgi:hypothetical protein
MLSRMSSDRSRNTRAKSTELSSQKESSRDIERKRRRLLDSLLAIFLDAKILMELKIVCNST